MGYNIFNILAAATPSEKVILFPAYSKTLVITLFSGISRASFNVWEAILSNISGYFGVFQHPGDCFVI